MPTDHSTESAAPRASLSIRARLMVLAMMALAPLMVDRIRGIEADRAERIDSANQQALALVRQGVEAQREAVISARAFLQVAARAHAMLAVTPDSCNRFLVDIASHVSWRTFSVADADGRIICSSRPEAIGLDISDRQYFRQALRTGQFVVSDYALGRLDAGPMAIAVFPRRSGDRTEAVLIGGLDLSWLTRLTNVAAEQPGSAVLMIDGAGNVLTHQPDAAQWGGRAFRDHPLVHAMLAASEGVVSRNGLDGVRRVFAFVQLPGTGTRLAVGLDEGKILQGVDRAMRYAYLQLAAIGALLLLAIWIGGDRLIVRPIRLLARLAERFGRGDYEMRAGERPWAAEFMPLVTALDEMTKNIAARREEARQMTERLNELATKDELSGLANRRAFDAALTREWKRAAMRGEGLALVMIDADHFKAFNDHYGHVGGDTCLRTLGEILGRAVRTDLDLAARYGGEEFAILLPGMEAADAFKLAEQLRADVAARCLRHAKAPCGFVTVSVGVAALRPEAGEGAQSLVEAADAALYAAKRRGRNTVVADEPVMRLAS